MYGQFKSAKMPPTHANMVRAANSASDDCSRVKNAWVGGHVTLIVYNRNKIEAFL